MITSQQVKAFARKAGADLVGIGDINRFAGTAPRKDPRHIAPDAKAIVGLGFRVLRGSLRGVEEGTQFYQYAAMSVANLEEVYAPLVLRRVGNFLEDHGFEAVVQRSIPDRRHETDPGVNPERGPVFQFTHAEPVAPGKPAPDVLMDFVAAAYVCGLGEIGHGGFFLTPEFGPLQRFVFILTDAPLKPDPLYDGQPLCDRCGQCAQACPGKAIHWDETVSKKLAGNDLAYARLDEWRCAAYYAGADRATNPFLSPETRAEIARQEPDAGAASPEQARGLMDVCYGAYPGVGFGYKAAVCGKACVRACLIHLEERGVLKQKFQEKFRRQPAWRLAGPSPDGPN